MFRALILGLVQGLTEFIPVSSSGHLVLVPFVLGWAGASRTFELGVPFDVAVHLGTALAVVVYFRQELGRILVGALRWATGQGDRQDRAMGWLAVLLAIGSAPAAAVGILFEDFFEDLFDRPQLVALLLVGTAVLLLTGELIHRRQGEERRDFENVDARDAVTIGIFQALAIAPGISRSGATIVGGLGRRLSRDAAARFSFLLGLPAIAGAGIVQLPDFPSGTEWGPVVAATAVSAVVGFAAIAFLLRYLRTRDLRPFAWYCVLAAAVALGFWLWLR
jgi:undecaprenyl-diphosphatase